MVVFAVYTVAVCAWDTPDWNNNNKDSTLVHSCSHAQQLLGVTLCPFKSQDAFVGLVGQGENAVSLNDSV